MDNQRFNALESLLRDAIRLNSNLINILNENYELDQHDLIFDERYPDQYKFSDISNEPQTLSLDLQECMEKYHPELARRRLNEL